MSAAVVSLLDFGARRANAEQRIHDAVLASLRGRCETLRIAQAQARAARNLRCGGVSFDEAKDRAVLWALYATDGTRPTSPRSA